MGGLEVGGWGGLGWRPSKERQIAQNDRKPGNLV